MSSFWSNLFKLRRRQSNVRLNSGTDGDIFEEDTDVPLNSTESSCSFSSPAFPEAEEDESKERLDNICEHLNIENEEIRHHREVMKPTLFVRNDGYVYPLLSSFMASCEPSCGSNTEDKCPGCGSKSGSCGCQIYFCEEGCTCKECQKEEAAIDAVVEETVAPEPEPVAPPRNCWEARPLVVEMPPEETPEQPKGENSCCYDSKPDACPFGTSWYPNDYCKEPEIPPKEPEPVEEDEIILEDITVQDPTVEDYCKDYMGEDDIPTPSCTLSSVEILMDCPCSCQETVETPTTSTENVDSPPASPNPVEVSPYATQTEAPTQAASACAPPELPKDIEKILANVNQTVGQAENPPPQCRRVICYVCEFEEPTETIPPPVKDEAPASEPVKDETPAPTPAEPEPCLIVPEKKEEGPEPEPCPCDAKEVCDCSAGEPAQPTEEPASVKGFEISPPCPVDGPPAEIPDKLSESEDACREGEISNKADRIVYLKDVNTRFMNKFCACRKCIQEGGTCDETEPGSFEPYKCSCPECGESRGENPECPMCNFASHMDNCAIKAKLREQKLLEDSEECDCEQCIRDRFCGTHKFDREEDGNIKYEGGMCQSRASTYLWEATNTPNSYRDFSFQSQEFGRFNDDDDCGGPCAKVDKKYSGGMTLEEAEDWNWCHK